MANTLNQKEDRKLKTKDLIYAGAFCAIYLVIMLLIVMACGSVPILYFMAPLFVGVVDGTVYMLYAMKVHKFGAVLILGILFALITSSSVWYSLCLALVAALAAELILKAGNYTSKKLYVLSYIVFNINMAAPTLMLMIDRNRFFAMSETYYGQNYATAQSALVGTGPFWLFILCGALVGGLLGALLATRLIGKHFKRAGIL